MDYYYHSWSNNSYMVKIIIMIGPHEGKELELMLSGDKKLAVFHDTLPDDGVISEDIIPEEKFAPYVADGNIKRLSRDIPNMRKGGALRFVCFTLPDEEWRAEFFLWYKSGFLRGDLQYHPAQERIIGALLGYAQSDIEDYIQKLES